MMQVLLDLENHTPQKNNLNAMVYLLEYQMKTLNKSELNSAYEYFFNEAIKFTKWFKVIFSIFVIFSLLSLFGNLTLISLTLSTGIASLAIYIYAKSCEIRCDIYINFLNNHENNIKE